jgi:hypothetical protein
MEQDRALKPWSITGSNSSAVSMAASQDHEHEQACCTGLDAELLDLSRGFLSVHCNKLVFRGATTRLQCSQQQVQQQEGLKLELLICDVCVHGRANEAIKSESTAATTPNVLRVRRGIPYKYHAGDPSL